MNEFVAENPGATVAFISFLISLFGIVTLAALRLGYSHAMRRFNLIEEDEKLNREEHGEIKASLEEHGNRLVRIETLVINGGKE